MIRALAWLRANEPVRLLMYPAIVAVVAYLVVNGTISDDFAQVITAVIALVLGVPAIEATRDRVTPRDRVPAAAAAAARSVLDDVERIIDGTFGPSGANVVRQARAEIEKAHAAPDHTGPRHRGA
ncbi:phage holin [Nocardia neocaledoniensis]|uniref:phage holin n=1 Tax=Nocardia neocaledoniensis TaxID=236511 RepID=UPI0024539198|nr:hypothetical protein [Nocardia neocaledoniensis]